MVESIEYEFEEIGAYVDKQIDISRNYYSDIRSDQDTAERYYYCRAEGDLAPPEVDGRSSFVSSDVSDLIEWMLPSLMEMFTASGDAVSLDPQNSEDVEGAQEWTDYLNYLFYRRNNGFLILYQMVKDALLKKTGIVRVDWQVNKDTIREVYQQVSAEQIAMMEQEGEIIAATDRGDGYFDVQLQTVREKGKVAVQNVPNEEFKVSPTAKMGEVPSFIAQVTSKTLTELRSDGWDVPDEAADFNDNPDDEVMRYGQKNWDWDESDDEEAMREVRFVDAYCFYDLNDDGIAEYCRVVKAGSKVLLVEEVDEHPFAVGLAIIAPHQFYGISPADQAIDFEKLNTDVMRAFIDNLQMQVNGRTGAIENQVNIDDLLNIRPGGIVRMKQQGAVFPLTPPNVMDEAISAVQVFDGQKENRTGWTKYSQGTDSNSLNKTATGINIITNRGDMRVKLIGRTMAETGIVELFRKMMKVASKNATGAERFRLNGKVTEIDPRQVGQYDFIVNVGLGAGNKDQRIAHITNMLNMQEKFIQLGVARPANVYNALAALGDETGFKNTEKFFTNPEAEGDPEKQQLTQQLQQAEQAVEQLKGMLQESQQQAEARIQALEQQLENMGEAEKTKQAMIQNDIEKQKTAQKEIDLALERLKTPMIGY